MVRTKIIKRRFKQIIGSMLALTMIVTGLPAGVGKNSQRICDRLAYADETDEADTIQDIVKEGQIIFSLASAMAPVPWDPINVQNAMTETEWPGIYSADINVPSEAESQGEWDHRFAIVQTDYDTCSTWNRILLGVPEVTPTVTDGVSMDMTNIRIELSEEARTVTVYFDALTYAITLRDEEGNPVDYTISWVGCDDDETYYTPEELSELTFEEYYTGLFSDDRREELDKIGVEELPDFVMLEKYLSDVVGRKKVVADTNQNVADTIQDIVEEGQIIYSIGSAMTSVPWEPINGQNAMTETEWQGIYSFDISVPSEAESQGEWDHRFSIIQTDYDTCSTWNRILLGVPAATPVETDDTSNCLSNIRVELGEEARNVTVYFDSTTYAITLRDEEGNSVDYTISWVGNDNDEKYYTPEELSRLTLQEYCEGLSSENRKEDLKQLNVGNLPNFVMLEKALSDKIAGEKVTTQTINVNEEENIKLIAESKYLNNDEVSYQWFKDNELIDDATEMEYIADVNDEMGSEYHCQMNDGEDTETAYYFVSRSTNGGIHLNYDYDSDVTVKYGEQAELKVEASSIGNKLSYQWYKVVENEYGDYDYVELEGANDTNYIVEGDENLLDGYGLRTRYMCRVTDGLSEETAYFNVYLDTGLSLTKYNYLSVKYGEETELKVDAESETGRELSYQWYKGASISDIEGDSDSFIIKGETGAVYTISGDKDSSDFYLCAVSDGIVTKYANFYVELDTGLTISYQGEVRVKYGEQAELKVEAQSDSGRELNYQWYKYVKSEYGYYEYVELEGANDTNYIVEGDENLLDGYELSNIYMCEVTDGLSEKTAYFNVFLDTGLSLTEYSYLSVKYGEETELKVDAESETGRELSYQWYKGASISDIKEGDSDSFIIKGETGAVYTISGDKDSSGYYLCAVSDGIVTKFVRFYVKLDTGLTISYEREVRVKYGVQGELKVEAQSDSGRELNYQWYKYVKSEYGYYEYVELEGANDTNYIVEGDENILDVDGLSTRYMCEVTDGLSEETAYFEVYLDTGLILKYYSRVKVQYGKETKLEVEAESDSGKGLSYQWYRYVREEDNDNYNYYLEEIEGATKANYMAEGNDDMPYCYECKVTDGIYVMWATFYMELDTGLSVDYNSNEVKVEYGKEEELKVKASSKLGKELSYQWYQRMKDEADDDYKYVKIKGATGTSYTITGDENISNQYYCEITDGLVKKEAYFNVKLYTGWTMTKYAKFVELAYGEETELTIDIKNDTEKQLSYQWYKENSNYEYVEIEGANSESYTLQQGEDKYEYHYKCEVTDGIVTETEVYHISQPANDDDTLTVTWVDDITVKYGDETKLTVEAYSKLGNELSYQWYYWENKYGNVKIEGATSAEYTITGNEDTSHRYRCEVTDGKSTAGVYFYITVDTNMKVNDDSYIAVKYGEKTELKVNATSGIGKELNYQWYKYVKHDEDDGRHNYSDYVEKKKIDEIIGMFYAYASSSTSSGVDSNGAEKYDLVKIEGATSAEYTITGNEDTSYKYYCEVTDGLDTKEVYYFVTLSDENENMKELTSLYSISVVCPIDSLEGDITLRTKLLSISDEEYKNIIFTDKVADSSVSPDDIRFTAYDISLVDENNNKVQPNGTVMVKVPCPTNYDETKCKVYRVNDNGDLTDMKAEYSEGYMVFETDHFSIYIITETELITSLDVILGDVNGDGNVDIKDSALLKRYLAGWEVDIDLTAADMDGDGNVTIKDSALLKRQLAGWE